MLHIKFVEQIKTHVLYSLTFFLIHTVYDIMRKDTVVTDRSQMVICVTVWRMCIAFWIPTATNTYSEYLILTAFPLQQWLHESATILRYT